MGKKTKSLKKLLKRYKKEKEKEKEIEKEKEEGRITTVSFWERYFCNIKELENRSVLSFVIFKRDWLKKMYDETKEISNSNEVQFFGDIISFQIEKNNYVHIPLSIITPEQKVSSASVDFSLDDTREILNSLTPQYKNLLQNLSLLKEKYSYKISRVGLNIHKHPSAFGFSGTDKDKKDGCCFRFNSAQKVFSVDAIVYKSEDTFKFYCVETSLHNYESKEDENGYVLSFPNTFLIIDKPSASPFVPVPENLPLQDIFSYTPSPNLTVKELLNLYEIPNHLPLLKFFVLYLSCNYEPIFLINKDKIKEEKIRFSWKEWSDDDKGFGGYYIF